VLRGSDGGGRAPRTGRATGQDGASRREIVSLSSLSVLIAADEAHSRRVVCLQENEVAKSMPMRMEEDGTECMHERSPSRRSSRE
jgi:hypothetical protein